MPIRPARFAFAAAPLGIAAIAAAACTETLVDSPIDAGTDALADGAAADVSTDSNTDGGPTKLTLQFEARVGAEAFSCQKVFSDLGTTKAKVEPLDFRLYVHDVKLVRADSTEVKLALEQDGTWQLDDVALLDFEDKTGTCSNGTTPTRTTIVGTAPAGVYTGVKLTLGLPLIKNHADVALAPSPLNLSGLFWSWQSGYKFLRVDSRIALGDAGVPEGGAPVFNVHLGSTGCTGDPADGGTTTCTNLNVAQVSLALDPSKDVIVVDYAALVEKSDLSVNAGGAPGCMSGTTDPECPAIFSALGVDLASGSPKVGQVLFRKK